MDVFYHKSTATTEETAVVVHLDGKLRWQVPDSYPVPRPQLSKLSKVNNLLNLVLLNPLKSSIWGSNLSIMGKYFTQGCPNLVVATSHQTV